MILTFFPYCRCWDLEVKRSAKTLTKPALSRVLFKCYGRSFAVAGLFVLLLVGAAGEQRRQIVLCATLISPLLGVSFLGKRFACKPHYSHIAAV